MQLDVYLRLWMKSTAVMSPPYFDLHSARYFSRVEGQMSTSLPVCLSMNRQPPKLLSLASFGISRAQVCQCSGGTSRSKSWGTTFSPARNLAYEPTMSAPCTHIL